jgi:hypothetical protein
MRLAYAVIAGLALGGGLGWWMLDHPGYETDRQKAERVETAQQAREAAKPKLYRWRDDNGVLQLTDKPPSGRKYELVELREDVNVVPMSGPQPEKPAPK